MPTGRLMCFSTVGGSMGDVRPLIALALAMRARGFDIIVLGDAAFEAGALRAGLRSSEWFTVSQVPQTFILRTVSGQRRLWGKRQRFRDRWMHRELRTHRQDRMNLFWRTVDGPDNPTIVAAIGGIPAFEMLLGFGPQCARIVSSPWPLQPSRRFTLAHPAPSVSERLHAWRFHRQFKARHERRFCEELFHLVSASPSVFPRPEDWLPNMQVTGYINLEEDYAGWVPPAPLREFLECGSPPIYIGFGSYAFLFGERGERLAQEIIRGCRSCGVRCIIHSSDLSPSRGSEHVFVLDETIPFRWLFPRCAVIVHHGGYGTVHAALMAQRPMIVYPFQTDQFFWAARMGALGVGPGFTARLRDLSARRLASDLAFVTSRGCRERAERLGAAMSTEQGLTVQLTAIESILEHTRRGLRPTDWRMPDPRASERFGSSRSRTTFETA